VPKIQNFNKIEHAVYALCGKSIICSDVHVRKFRFRYWPKCTLTDTSRIIVMEDEWNELCELLN
jgi:hypothetical protein